ncbi:prolactin regulatory element-binding protein [Astyanax mexicanus]|uniref:prolactin regulatory element-binding protein n=1 Tax=Astyanax mexicanus TaxID=7994 RepID=UPI0020CB47B5|nr:prolactin regulatory element-binding protein [Astyanax mexicanus]XP_022529431.2 prolactin regulatory element-binding protein [Astyanax mexicanus]XP_022529432.2 prolactin regulatory element-binding protein [Astyanax mexicanus]XP_022529433.2 prolactin regulatory element-binding protein [Astyanax mexicanus]
MGKRKVPDLYRAPFPLYTVKIDPKTGIVLTAGGGGASKTGIKNGVHFLSLELVGSQHSATLLHSHDTETRATMNMALGGDVVAAGQDGNCSLMRFRQRAPKEGQSAPTKDGAGQQGGARRRGGKGQNGGGDVAQMKDESLQVLVEDVGTVKSDLSPQDPMQKCVRFSSDLKLLLTGGADGYLRAWEYPSLKEKLNFKAHTDEVEDLDISPDNKHIVTVGRDFACNVWSGDQLAMGLCWHENMSHITEKMYRYQSCRFAKVEDQKDALRLYTVQIPYKRERKPLPCYLTKWDGKSFLPLLTKTCGNEVISCLSVSDCGTFLGLGTITGSVAIYIAFSLQKLYYVQESHGIVVTDLAFLPDSPKCKPVKGNNEVAVLSVAVDSRCQLHAVSNRRSVPVWLVLFLCGLLLVGVVLLLQHLFPGFI